MKPRSNKKLVDWKTRTTMVFSSASFLLLFLLQYCCTGTHALFRLGIRDSFMIAHSFHHHPAFGPAGGLHGATYTCDVEFACTELTETVNWVLDIGKASEILARVLQKYDYQNLDELFGPNVMTTTEIHADIKECIVNDDSIEFDGELCVKLWESHKAWASYTE